MTDKLGIEPVKSDSKNQIVIMGLLITAALGFLMSKFYQSQEMIKKERKGENQHRDDEDIKLADLNDFTDKKRKPTSFSTLGYAMDKKRTD